MAKPKRGGLGRGIGALIPSGPEEVPTEGEKSSPGSILSAGQTASARPVDVFFSQDAPQTDLVAVPGARLSTLLLADIVPNAKQPRTYFNPDDLAELVHSIREVGVLQPIVVRQTSDSPIDGVKYELIMGERRFRASKELGLETIPAIVRETADEDMLRDALLENLHRSELNPLEEASAYQQLLSDFGITQEQLAEKIGRSRPQISNTLRLLKLPIEVQTKVAAGVLSSGHARAVLSVGETEGMLALANKIVNEDLSVRAAEAAASAGNVRKPAKIRAGKVRGHLDDLSERLGDSLNTKVKITLGASKGQIVIDFATVQDLNRILEELGQSQLNG